MASALPPVTRQISSSRGRRQLLGQRRRISLNVLPGTEGCTLLPGLASVDGLLNEEPTTVEDIAAQIQYMNDQLDPLASSSVSPERSKRGISASSVSPERSPKKKEEKDRREAVTPRYIWRILILGRTFEEQSETFVTDCLAEVLELDPVEAAARVAAAKGQMTSVIDSCQDRNLALDRMQALLSRGLVVQVTTENMLLGRGRRFSTSAVEPTIGVVVEPPATPSSGKNSTRRPSKQAAAGADGRRRQSKDASFYSSVPNFTTSEATSPRRRSKESNSYVSVPSFNLSEPDSPRSGTKEATYNSAASVFSTASGSQSPPNRFQSKGAAPESARSRQSELLEQAMAMEVQVPIPQDAVQAFFEAERQSQEQFAEKQEESKSDVLSDEEKEKEKGEQTEEEDGEEEDDESDQEKGEKKEQKKALSSPKATSPAPQKIPKLKQLMSKHPDVFPACKAERRAARVVKVEEPASTTSSTARRKSKADQFQSNVSTKSTVSEAPDSPRSSDSKTSPARKEACEMMRFLAFGAHVAMFSTKDGVPLEKEAIDAIYSEAIGCKEDVRKVLAVFNTLDCDRNGRVDGEEMQINCDKLMQQRFRELERSMVWARGVYMNLTEGTSQQVGSKPPSSPTLTSEAGRGKSKSSNLHPGRRHSYAAGSPGRVASPERDDSPESGESLRARARRISDSIASAAMLGYTCPKWAQAMQHDNPARVSARALEKLTTHLLGKKGSFAIEDMMRTIWMKAKRDDIKTMKSWCKQFFEEARNARVSTPPLLQQGELDGLRSVFKHYDTEGTGCLSFDQLVTLGLIYKDQKEKCKEEWDSDGNGIIDIHEFCEMMCPAGYRATRDSKVGTIKDGTRVRFDMTANCWRVENADIDLLSLNPLHVRSA